jgi:N-acetyl sugar amidotransferase
MKPLWSDEVEARVREHATNIDPQELPTDVQFCTRCVVSNQRPRITFDDEGVCSACRFAEHKRMGIDWEQRGAELENLLEGHRSSVGYDCIVPCSGGKDSSVVAHKLKHEHGMHPLCVSFAPFGYTDIGLRNLEAFGDSGFDIVTGRANGEIHRKMSRLGLEYIGDPFLPFIWGQLAFPMQVAMAYGIKLVFGGENGEAEYGGDTGANDKPCWSVEDWERIYWKGNGIKKMIAVGEQTDAITSQDVDNMPSFYMGGPTQNHGIEYHWWSYYNFWHPQANYYHATEHTGFMPNDQRSTGTYSKYSSIDDRFDDPHYYLAYIKFGIGRATSDAAHEVRDGDISREEAVSLVQRFDGEFPIKHQGEFYDYLGIDEAHFNTICNRFRPDHLWKRKGVIWEPGDSPWELRHRVQENETVEWT